MSNVIPLPGVEASVPSAAPPKQRGLARGKFHPWPNVPGGRIWVSKTGVCTYHVEREIAGKRYHARFPANDPETALGQLREWAKNPMGWNPAGVAPAEPVRLTAALIEAYVRWLTEVPPGKKRVRNTDASWISAKKNYLTWWLEKLAGRNLRNDGSRDCVTTDDLRDLLKGATSVRHRVEAIRHLYTFLLTEARGAQRILEHHNPSKPLRLGKPDPAQIMKGSKVEWQKEDADKVIAWLERQTVQRRRVNGKDTFNTEEAAAYLVLKVTTVRALAERGKLQHEGGGQGATLVFRRKHLDRYDRARRRHAADVPQRVAFALVILGGTMWHVREVFRFGQHGEVFDLPPDHAAQNGAAKVLVCEHKIGHSHPQAVTERVAAAAAEFVRLGGVNYNAIFKWTEKAVKATGVAKFCPGQFRHRGSTLQVNRGATLAAVAKARGHRSVQTTKIYTVKAVEPKLPTWY